MEFFMLLTHIVTYSTGIMFWLIVIFSKKHISKMEMYTSTFFALYFELLANVILDLKYDLYGYFNKGVDWATLPALLVIFPAINILFLNFYPFTKSISKQLLYILLCSIIGISFEWVYLQTEFFYHNGWSLWYSFLSYPIIFYILFLNLRIIRKLKSS
jgi:hypothetical protein